jgi:hypothetical protein
VREDIDLHKLSVIYFGFNGKISFCLPVVLLVSPFGFGWILESCFSVDDFALRFSSLVSPFRARDFPYCLGLPLKHIALAFFLLFFYTRSRSLVRCSHPRFRFAPAVDLGMALWGCLVSLSLFDFLGLLVFSDRISAPVNASPVCTSSCSLRGAVCSCFCPDFSFLLVFVGSTADLLWSFVFPAKIRFLLATIFLVHQDSSPARFPCRDFFWFDFY